MSDIDSTAATQGTPPSPMTSSYASPKPSQETYSHHRSPSPAGRDTKRRRIDSAFPEIRTNSEHSDYSDDPSNNIPPHIASQSAPTPPLLFDSADPFEPQPRTFLGHNREFMSHILSIRGVGRRPGSTIRRHSHIASFRFGVENLQLVSTDNTSFIGWREKANTWPMEKVTHVQRSFTL